MSDCFYLKQQADINKEENEMHTAEILAEQCRMHTFLFSFFVLINPFLVGGVASECFFGRK
jgi:hypothetical protein